jgi:hypothetical protein
MFYRSKYGRSCAFFVSLELKWNPKKFTKANNFPMIATPQLSKIEPIEISPTLKNSDAKVSNKKL